MNREYWLSYIENDKQYPKRAIVLDIFDDIESRICENCKYYEEVARGSSIYRCNKSVVSSPTGCNDLNGYSIRLLGCNKFERKGNES